MTRENARRRKLNEWSVAQLRLTVFPQDMAPIPAEDWWRVATGNPPENVQHDVRNGAVTATGMIHENSQLTLSHILGRIDWTWGAALNPLQNPFELPQIGTYVEEFQHFRDWMRAWSPNCPGSIRLAFGATLQLPMPNRIASYRELCNYLNFDVDGNSTSDFLYQINRRREWGFNGQQIQINRLFRWSAGILRLARGHIGTVEQTMPSVELHYVNLELDINTDPAFRGPFNGDGLIAALEHFSDLAVEITLEGDIP